MRAFHLLFIFDSKCENREVICQKYFCSNKSEQINQLHMQNFSDISLTAKLSSKELFDLKNTILIVLYIQYESRESTVPIVNVREEYLAKVQLGMSPAIYSGNGDVYNI